MDAWPQATPRPYHVATERWTEEQIAAALRTWAQETGSTPRSWEWCPGSARSAGLLGPAPTKFERERDRWPGNTTVYRMFGSWGEACRAAGLPGPPPPPGMPLRERVETALRLAAAGESLQMIADHVGVKPDTARRYLRAHPCHKCAAPVVGTSALCRVCSTRAGNPRRWTEAQLLEAARVWQRETGRLPTARDWRPGSEKWEAEAPRWPPAGAVKISLGGFQELRLALDARLYNVPWDHDSALEAIRRYHHEHGRPPTKHGWESGAGEGYPSASTVLRLFGSFSAGVRAAGVEPAGARAAWTKERVVAAIRAFAEREGRAPAAYEWNLAGPDHPSRATVLARFGSFAAGVAAALDER